jgi:hypothetical protein
MFWSAATGDSHILNFWTAVGIRRGSSFLGLTKLSDENDVLHLFSICLSLQK